ncbi:unnamed protein product [Discosporangium mesarthrocarpum]
MLDVLWIGGRRELSGRLGVRLEVDVMLNFGKCHGLLDMQIYWLESNGSKLEERGAMFLQNIQGFHFGKRCTEMLHIAGLFCSPRGYLPLISIEGAFQRCLYNTCMACFVLTT